MSRFKVPVISTERAVIEYTADVEASSKEEAIEKVKNAIERDGTAFIEFDCIKEKILETFQIDGQSECIDEDYFD